MSTLLLYLGIFAVFFVVGVPIVLSLSLSAIILLYFSDVQVLDRPGKVLPSNQIKFHKRSDKSLPP